MRFARQTALTLEYTGCFASFRSVQGAIPFRRSVRETMAAELAQMRPDFQNISKAKIHIPQTCMFTFDSSAKTQTVMSKNVY